MLRGIAPRQGFRPPDPRSRELYWGPDRGSRDSLVALGQGVKGVSRIAPRSSGTSAARPSAIGSFNWTKVAQESNAENLVMLPSKEIAGAYGELGKAPRDGAALRQKVRPLSRAVRRFTGAPQPIRHAGAC